MLSLSVLQGVGIPARALSSNVTRHGERNHLEGEKKHVKTYKPKGSAYTLKIKIPKGVFTVMPLKQGCPVSSPLTCRVQLQP